MLALTALCLLTFWHVPSFDFVFYDDPVYVSENASLADGLTLAAVRYAFTTNEANLWHPITWLSHGLDIQLFGRENASGHHAVNLAIHLANTLLFLILGHRIAARWKSPSPIGVGLIAAALFCVHPLHVETVAWISDRKGLLSTLFSLIALVAYLRPGRSTMWRMVTLACFVLAIMAKPSSVILPGIFVALDATVRRKVGFEESLPDPLALFRKQFVDKWLFGLLSIGAAAMAILFQSGGSHDFFKVSLATRLTSLPARLGFYAHRTIWPSDLNFSYSFPSGHYFTIYSVIGLILLVIGALLAVNLWRRKPWFTLAWAWAILAFLPVSGISTVGASFTTDRYTYFLHGGLFLWVAFELIRFKASLKPLMGRLVGVGVLGVVALLAGLSHLQANHWRESESLFLNSTISRPSEPIGFTNLGTLYDREGRIEEAIVYYKKGLALKPSEYVAHYNLGTIYRDQGNTDAAADSYRDALDIYPDYPPALLSLAQILMGRYNTPASAESLDEAVDLLTRSASSARLNRPLYLNTLVEAFILKNDFPSATQALREALASPTNNPELRNELERKRAEFQAAGIWK